MSKLMGRFLILTIAMAFTTSALEAQGIRLGVKAGAASSDLAKVDNTEAGWGFVGGAYAGIGLGSIVIQPEVLYAERKTTLGSDGELKQSYIDVPLLVGFNFGVIVKPFLYVAPVLSFETSCGLTIDALSQECTDFDTKSALFSGAIGAALDIAMFTIDVRYNLGFSDIADGEEGKWNTLMIMGGFGFSLGL
jgi:hypothetical protein